MKINHIFITLLSIVIILLALDLILGCWYYNKNNLIFSSSEFNNIVTPSLTIVATIIYALALFSALNQNKIVLSQNLKPHYLEEIKKLEKRAKKTIIVEQGIFPDEKINAENYISFIMKVLVKLTENIEYNEDFKNYLNGNKLTNENIRERSYYTNVMFLTRFTFHLNEIHSLLSEVASFVQEINLSKLIKEDKEILKKQITRTFFQNYIEFIEFEDNHDFVPQIPILYRRPTESDLYFEKLSQTNFRNLYHELKRENFI